MEGEEELPCEEVGEGKPTCAFSEREQSFGCGKNGRRKEHLGTRFFCDLPSKADLGTGKKKRQPSRRKSGVLYQKEKMNETGFDVERKESGPPLCCLPSQGREGRRGKYRCRRRPLIEREGLEWEAEGGEGRFLPPKGKSTPTPGSKWVGPQRRRVGGGASFQGKSPSLPAKKKKEERQWPDKKEGILFNSREMFLEFAGKPWGH